MALRQIVLFFFINKFLPVPVVGSLSGNHVCPCSAALIKALCVLKAGPSFAWPLFVESLGLLSLSLPRALDVRRHTFQSTDQFCRDRTPLQ